MKHRKLTNRPMHGEYRLSVLLTNSVGQK